MENMEKKYNNIIRILKREIQKLEEIINDLQCKFLMCKDNNIEISDEQSQHLKELMRKDNLYINLLIYTVRKRNKYKNSINRGNNKHEKRQYTVNKYIRRR